MNRIRSLRKRILAFTLTVIMAFTPTIDLAAQTVPQEVEPVESAVVVVEEQPLIVEEIVEETPEPIAEVGVPEEPVEPEAPIETEEPETPAYTLSEEDIELIALVTMAEAEGECELGKRLVIDTILNRMDHEKKWPDTAYGVIYQKHQFTSMWNGRVNRCYVRDDIVQLVREELESRTNYDCYYFRMDRYCEWGPQLFKVGCHYFSGI